MTVTGAFVLLFVLLALSVGTCLLSLFSDKERESKPYDERQEIARGKGYQLAFLVLQVYLLIVLLVDLSAGLEWVSLQLVVLIGFMVGMFTFDTYCMLTGASLSVGEKPGRNALFSSGMAVLWFVSFFGYLEDGASLSMTGEGPYHWMRLFLGVVFAYRALGYFIQYLREKRE